MRILLAEDDKDLNKALTWQLTARGYNLDSCENGEDALYYGKQNIYDIILLDRMLPDREGTEVMTELRRLSVHTPIILITALGLLQDKITGLDLGADDYLVKPFDVVELVARVEAVLRRYNKTEQHLSVGDVTVDVEARRVIKAGKPVELTNKEFGLLVLFMKNKNVALFRETLYEKVWEEEYYGDSRTLDLHVQRLRKKLGWEHKLLAVYKVGYRLEVPQ